MSVTFHAVIDGKYWQISSIHGYPGHEWAWLTNIDKPTEQVRLSMRHPDLERYEIPKRRLA